ncbi:MAG TPA: hypothetical protein VJP80_07350 [Candidatus Saccharimonadales bacterium]|nr:hypothetical protein [Candidatus Saccharimonadales bacterium]
MNDLELLIVGALLAIVGGGVSDELRSWRERSRKRAAMQVSLADELREIEATIGKMHEVWNSAQVFPPSYVADILSGTAAYDNLRPDLYLIKDTDLRKELHDFYKKLKDAARNTDGKLGSLSEAEEARTEQAGFDSTFQTLCAEAKNIRKKLE